MVNHGKYHDITWYTIVYYGIPLNTYVYMLLENIIKYVNNANSIILYGFSSVFLSEVNW